MTPREMQVARKALLAYQESLLRESRSHRWSGAAHADIRAALRREARKAADLAATLTASVREGLVER